jgi:hypothetical protein
MLICLTPHEESSIFLCVIFRLVCEWFGLFTRGSNVFCERFVLHVWAFIVFTSIGLNCVCVHDFVTFGRPYGRFGLHRFSAILHQWMHRSRVLFREKSAVTSFSHPEPFLRAVRWGALAKSIFRTGIWLASSNIGHCFLTMFLWYPVMDLARAPHRAARKKGSGDENAVTTSNLLF